MITPNQRVEVMNENGELSTAFGFATNIGTALNPQYFFSEIYAPIKTPTASEMPNTWTYVNIGVDNTYLAQIYNTYYSRNFLIRDKALKLFPFIQGVFLKNKYKYQRMIEIQGYTFNPLWNVDADERYAYIDRHGTETDTNTHKYNEETTHTINQDVFNYSRDFTDTAATNFDTKTTTSATDSNTRHNKTDTQTDNQDTITKTHTEITGASATATLNPLEFAVTGDTAHVERHIRQGNIGTTKTTELLEDAIQYIRNNVITEFFNDINEVILAGVYDVF